MKIKQWSSCTDLSANLQDCNHEGTWRWEDYLKYNSAHIPTTTFGDGCTINFKGARLLEEKYGLKLPSSKWSSHLTAGAIRRMCTLVNSTKKDVAVLYENLCTLPKHYELMYCDLENLIYFSFFAVQFFPSTQKISLPKYSFFFLIREAKAKLKNILLLPHMHINCLDARFLCLFCCRSSLS